MEEVEVPHDAGDAGLGSFTKVGAGMQDERADAELFAPKHFVGKGAEGFLEVLALPDTEVDQVAGMGDHGAELPAQGVIGEGLGVGFGQGLGEPLHIVLHEDLHRRAADPDAAVDREGHSPDGRNMGSQQGEQVGRGGFFGRHDGRC